MLKAGVTMLAVAAICAATSIDRGYAQAASPATPTQTPAPADLGGTYQCQPDPTPCLWSGQSPSISQSGGKFDIKNDKGEAATATLTSAATISVGGPMNAYGVIASDHSIEWSNGNKWRKQ